MPSTSEQFPDDDPMNPKNKRGLFGRPGRRGKFPDPPVPPIPTPAAHEVNMTTSVATPTKPPIVKISSVRQISGHDRCDVRDCNAESFVALTFVSGGLFFCGHHYDEVEKTIAPKALIITDERAFMNPPKGKPGNGFA